MINELIVMLNGLRTQRLIDCLFKTKSGVGAEVIKEWSSI